MYPEMPLVMPPDGTLEVLLEVSLHVPVDVPLAVPFGMPLTVSPPAGLML